MEISLGDFPVDPAIGKYSGRLNMVDLAARVAHGAERAYCEAKNLYPPEPWCRLQPNERKRLIEWACCAIDILSSGKPVGVELRHEIWRNKMEADGWQPGPEMCYDERRHPNLVPFCDLLPESRAIECVLVGVVTAIYRADQLDREIRSCETTRPPCPQVFGTTSRSA